MILLLLHKFGPLFIFVALALGIVGLPIPDEVLLLSTGLLIAQNKLNPVAAGLAALFGSITGITASYLIGRWAGPKVVKKFGKYINVSEEKLLTVNKWFLRIGKWLLLIGYFIPLFRHLVGLVAGGTKLNFKVFALFAYVGAFFWVLIFLSIGYYLSR